MNAPTRLQAAQLAYDTFHRFVVVNVMPWEEISAEWQAVYLRLADDILRGLDTLR